MSSRNNSRIDIPSELQDRIEKILLDCNLDISRYLEEDSKMRIDITSSGKNDNLVIDNLSKDRCTVYLTKDMSDRIKRLIYDSRSSEEIL